MMNLSPWTHHTTPQSVHRGAYHIAVALPNYKDTAPHWRQQTNNRRIEDEQVGLCG
ncbi:hypothetical protein [Nostoc sp. C052]|uniref:hypothetical protein n=1 Tax=Nostoc sp. C052 TaxID=2576902 RepID=UPI0015C31F4C|nr:hypothetical protein [Nostoc sp. C052]